MDDAVAILLIHVVVVLNDDETLIDVTLSYLSQKSCFHIKVKIRCMYMFNVRSTYLRLHETAGNEVIKPLVP